MINRQWDIGNCWLVNLEDIGADEVMDHFNSHAKTIVSLSELRGTYNYIAKRNWSLKTKLRYFINKTILKKNSKTILQKS